jgi:hypothetical protein
VASLTRRLEKSAVKGEVLDLAGTEVINRAAMRGWGPSRTVQASMIREILRGRFPSGANPEPLDPHGLRLRGARIAGRLDLEDLSSEIGLQLTDCLLSEGVNATDATLPFLSLPGSVLEHSNDSPFAGQGLTVSFLDLSDTRVVANSSSAAINLQGAHIGDLDCGGARIRNAFGAALLGSYLQIDRGADLVRLKARGKHVGGTIQLYGARIGGQLICSGANLRNTNGAALAGDRLRVDQNVVLTDLTAVGVSASGTIRVNTAHIGGQLNCSGATLRNSSGPALDGDGLVTGQDLFLRDGFKATGSGDDGAVRLLGAHIGGQLNCSGATLRNSSGPALIAEDIRVDGPVFLSHNFEATGGGRRQTINLTGAHIGGTLVFEPAVLKHAVNDRQQLNVDGLTYSVLPGEIDLDKWLRHLRESTPRYAAQPYQHLANAYRAAGHDKDVRKILIAQRDDQLTPERTESGRRERIWGRLTKLTLGYGYQPWRALVLLLAVTVLAVTLALTLGAHGGLARANPASGTVKGCSTVEEVSVGLDLGLPLIKTKTNQCEVTSGATGQALTATGWALQSLAWAFATLFVAGFTGVVRKT